MQPLTLKLMQPLTFKLMQPLTFKLMQPLTFKLITALHGEHRAVDINVAACKCSLETLSMNKVSSNSDAVAMDLVCHTHPLIMTAY